MRGGLFSTLRQGAQKTLDTLNNNSDSIKRNLFTIGAVLADFIIVFRNQFTRLREPFSELGKSFSQLTGQFGTAKSPADTFNTVISALVTSIILLVNGLTAVVKFTKEFVEGLKNGELWAYGLLAALTPIAALLTTMWAVKQLNTFVSGIRSGIAAVDAFAGEIRNTKNQIDEAYSSLKKFSKEAGKKIEFAGQKTGESALGAARQVNAATTGIISGIGGAIGGSIAGAVTAAISSSAVISAIAGSIGGALLGVAGSIVAVITAPITLIVVAIVSAIVGLFLLIFTERGRKILSVIGNFFAKLPRQILDFVTGPLAYAAGYIIGQIGATIVGAIILIIAGIVRLGILIGQSLVKLAQDALVFMNNLVGVISAGLQAIPRIVSDAFSAMVAFITNTLPVIIQNIVNFFVSLPGLIATAISNIPSIVAGVFNAARNFVMNTLPQFINEVVNFFRRLPGQIVSVLSSLPSILSRVGRGLVESIIEGLRSSLGNIFHWGTRLIDSFFRGIQSAVRNNKVLRKALELIGVNFESHSPPIAGPLKNMDRWGINLGEVYAESLSKGLSSFDPTSLGMDNLQAPILTQTNSGTGTGSRSSSVNVSLNMNGIMARSRSDLRDVAKDMLSAVNEELRGRSLPEIGGGAI